MSRHQTIGVLGATGFTGRRVARKLAGDNVPLLLGARQQDALDELASELRSADSPLKTVVVDVTDPSAVADFCAGAATIINCVGPYAQLGELVVEMALGAGSHLLDLSGEQAYFAACRKRFDETAKSKGVAVVNGAAFEITVADCAVALAAEGFDDVSEILVGYWVEGFDTTKGTRLSIVDALGRPTMAFENGELVPRRPLSEMRRLEMPPPASSGPGFWAPGAEVEILAERYGATTVAKYLRLPPWQAAALAVATPVASALASSPWKDRLAAVSRLADRTPQDPGQCRFVVTAEVRGVAGGRDTKARRSVAGVDIYGVSAKIAAYVAESLMTTKAGTSGVVTASEVTSAAALLDGVGLTTTG